jgi:uncharacterized protein DUF6519
MKGDFTRSTFRSDNHYSSVRFRQGSVILDAEINEEVDILAHVERTTNGDTIGRCGAPYHDPGTFKNFAVKIGTGGTDLLIAPGHIYVDGILCENDIETGLFYTKQPDFPDAKPPAQAGSHIVFLDVWERFITAVDQYGDAFPLIRETALNGPDTASRSRVVWQVKLAPIDGNTCERWTPPAQSTGRLRAEAEPSQTPTNDCMVPEGGGYRRLENQLYRVEIHQGSDVAKPQFKWSRDNGSVVSRVKATDQAAKVIIVEDPGRDEVLGFASAKFVELSDEERVLSGLPGLLLEVDTVTGTTVKVKNPTNAGLAGATNPVLRRWDGVGDLLANKVTALEDGVQIEFDGGTFATGDYWMFPARTLTGRVEWPGDGTAFEPRHGTIHHFCPLAVLSFNGETFTGTPTDCRKLFPPLTAIKASDVSYDPTKCANLTGADTVQEALDKLCQSTGGDEKGIHVKALTLLNGDPLQNDTLVSVRAFAEGVRVSCDQKVFPDSVRTDKGLPNPVCIVGLEMPWPLIPQERDMWGVGGAGFLGFLPIALAGQVTSEGTEIFWAPMPDVKRWLVERLLQGIVVQTHGQLQRVLARLTLKGNFIFGPDDAKLYLDGEVFGIRGSRGTLIDLPSGNGRRGGDLEMWFWLSPENVRVPPIGVITGKASRFFQSPSGIQAINLAIDRRSPALTATLPADYLVDATQAFDQEKATRFARDTGVPRLSMMAGERMGRVAAQIAEMITRNTQVRVDVLTVPDTAVPERVRAALAAGNAPDFVVGDEPLATQLAQLGFTNVGLVRL